MQLKHPLVIVLLIKIFIHNVGNTSVLSDFLYVYFILDICI